MPKDFASFVNTNGLLLVVAFMSIFEILFDQESTNQSALIAFSVIIIAFVLFMIFKSMHLINTPVKRLWFKLALGVPVVVAVAAFFLSDNTFLESYRLFIAAFAVVGINILILKHVEQTDTRVD